MNEKIENPDKPLTEYYRVRRLRYMADELEKRWLRSRGWHETSSTVQFRWMWKRKIGDELYTVTQEIAVNIQELEDTDLDYKLHPEDYKE